MLLTATIFVLALFATASCGGDDTPAAVQPTAAAPTALATTATTVPTAAVQPTATPAAVGKETTETLTVGGVQRTAVVYVPVKLSAAKAPAIVYLTAPGMQPQPLRARYSIGLDKEADRLGFVAAWPEGSNAPAQPGMGGATCCYWNHGTLEWGSQQPPDDVAFFKALMDLLVAKYPVDADRISFIGTAGGAVMAYRTACELSERIAGFADVSSSHRDNTVCADARPVSMLLMLGTANANVPFGGGISPLNGRQVPAVADVIDYWRKVDGCAGEAVITKLTAVTEQRRYGPCNGATEVVLVTVTGGGNGWWGSSSPTAATGDPDLKTTPIVAEFLIKQTRAGR